MNIKEEYDNLNIELDKIKKEHKQIHLKYHKDILKRVLNCTSFLNNNCSNVERIFCIKNYIFVNTICKNPNCNNLVKFNNKTYKYNIYCSRKCAENDPNKRKKYSQTCLEKYGVDNPMKNEEIKNKFYKSINEKNYDKIFSPDRFSLSTPLFNKEEYKGSKKDGNHILYKFKCNKCGLVFEDWFDFTYKLQARCPNCFPKKTSLFEKEFEYFIKSIYKNDIIRNNKNILDNLELDFYLPDKKIAFVFYTKSLYNQATNLIRKYYYMLRS